MILSISLLQLYNLYRIYQVRWFRLKNRYSIKVSQYYVPADVFLVQIVLFVGSLYLFRLPAEPYKLMDDVLSLYSYFFLATLLYGLYLLIVNLFKQRLTDVLYISYMGALFFLLFMGPLYFLIVKVLFVTLKEPVTFQVSAVPHYYIYKHNAGRSHSYRGAYGYFELKSDALSELHDDAFIKIKRPYLSLSRQEEQECLERGVQVLKEREVRQYICLRPKDERVVLDLYGYRFFDKIYIYDILSE